MAEHSTLTGASLHEAKGASTATVGQVPVASGSGTAPFGTLVNTSVPTGWPVQVTSTAYKTFQTITANIPIDNTIPQITEGTEVFTHSHTPRSTTNKLLIRVILQGSVSSGGLGWTAALFQDATANALAAAQGWGDSGGGGDNMSSVVFEHLMDAGTVAAITFRVRAGENSTNNLYINGAVGARLYGGVTPCSITVTEYKA